jgi:hypothetical protein
MLRKARRHVFCDMLGGLVRAMAAEVVVGV